MACLGSIRRNETLFLVLIVGAYTVVLSYLSFLRHWSFQSTFYDLGIFEHEFWLRLNGGLPGLQNLVFGGHISPTLYIFMPFYGIWPKAETLLILQSLVLGLSSVPIFFIAKETLSSWKLSVACSLVVLLYPPLQWVNLTDFHAQSLIPLFFLLSYFFYDKNKVLFFSSILLTSFTIEFAPIIVVFLGLFLLLRSIIQKRESRKIDFFRPLLAIVVGLLVIALDWIIVEWLQANYPPLQSQLAGYMRVLPLRVVGIPGGEPITLYGLISQPNTVTEMLFRDGYFKLAYLFLVLAPLCFLSLLDLSIITAIPWIGTALLTNYPPYYSIAKQYPGLLVGQLLLSAVLGLNWLHQRVKNEGGVAFMLLTTVLVSSIFVSPLSPLRLDVPSQGIERGFFLSMQKDSIIREQVLESIPTGKSVLATNDLGAHLSRRGLISTFRLDIPYPDVVVVDTSSRWFAEINKSYLWSLDELLKEGNYVSEKQLGSLIIYKLTSPPTSAERISITALSSTNETTTEAHIGDRLYFKGRALASDGNPYSKHRVHMFIKVDDTFASRSATDKEWNSEVTDDGGYYSTRWIEYPIPQNGPEWLEIRKDGIYINNKLRIWSGNPAGHTLKAFSAVWGPPPGKEPTYLEIKVLNQ